VRLALNAARRDLVRPEFAAEVVADLAAEGVAPGVLDLEISDRVPGADEAVAGCVAALRASGVRVVVDDFGAGDAALLRLARCPVDGVKLDPAFLARVDAAHVDVDVVRSVVALAHSLGLSVTAEGIETVHQLSAARRAGVDAVQGYLLARPAPGAAVTALLSSPAPVAARLLRSTVVGGVPSPRTGDEVSPSTPASAGRT
jgi:EAL domain-containing protein (putative c-di-GMP-specific phosphodiesterase class I)